MIVRLLSIVTASEEVVEAGTEVDMGDSDPVRTLAVSLSVDGGLYRRLLILDVPSGTRVVCAGVGAPIPLYGRPKHFLSEKKSCFCRCRRCSPRCWC